MATTEDRRKPKVFTHDFGILPIPKQLRYDPNKPFHFGVALNLAFGFASTFSEWIILRIQVPSNDLPFHQLLQTCTTVNHF